MRLRSSCTPPSRGIAPPQPPEPPAMGTRGTRSSWHQPTARSTSTRDSGQTTQAPRYRENSPPCFQIWVRGQRSAP